MKVFLSYPMNGRSRDTCLITREQMIRNLSDDDKWVDNLDCEAPKGSGPLYYLGEAIKQMADCDAIMLHPSWEFARGCRVEAKVAREYKLEIIDLSYQFTYDDLLTLCDGNVRATNAIFRTGVYTKSALVKTPIEEFSKKHGVGKKTLSVIAEAKRKASEEYTQ